MIHVQNNRCDIYEHFNVGFQSHGWSVCA